MTVFIENIAIQECAPGNPKRCSLIPLYLLPACEVLPLAFYPPPGSERGLTLGDPAVILGFDEARRRGRSPGSMRHARTSGRLEPGEIEKRDILIGR